LIIPFISGPPWPAVYDREPDRFLAAVREERPLPLPPFEDERVLRLDEERPFELDDLLRPLDEAVVRPRPFDDFFADEDRELLEPDDRPDVERDPLPELDARERVPELDFRAPELDPRELELDPRELELDPRELDFRAPELDPRELDFRAPELDPPELEPRELELDPRELDPRERDEPDPLPELDERDPLPELDAREPLPELDPLLERVLFTSPSSISPRHSPSSSSLMRM
jgi:hypothetical protein